MNEIKLLTGNEFDVQLLMIENEPWFVARHVLNTLEIKDTHHALEDLKESEKLTRTLHVSGQNREVILISEPGLYKILMRSNKPKAKPFQDWLAHEVIPSIRKTGSYHVIPQSFSEALQLAADLQKTLEKQAPKVLAYDSLMNSEGNYSMAAAAKILNTGRNKLYTKLRQHKMIRPNNTEPYQEYVDIGIFAVKACTVNNKALIQTFVTPKGLRRIMEL